MYSSIRWTVLLGRSWMSTSWFWASDMLCWNMAANTGDLAKFQCLSLVQSDLPDHICSDQSLCLHSCLVSARLVMACLVSSRLCLTWLVSAHLGLAHLVSAWNTSTLMTKVIQLPSSLKLKFVSSACLVLSCLCLAWRVSARLGSSRLGSSLG